MIKRLYDGLLRYAAGRWPATVAESMLEEWQAELHAEPRPLRRLKFAASLAVSRPHSAQAVAPTSTHWAVLGSVALLVALPFAWMSVVYGLLGLFVDLRLSIGWQALTWALLNVIAVGVGVICARWTTGVSQLLPSIAIAIWTFGVQVTALAVVFWSLARAPVMLTLGNNAVWAASGIVCTLVCARLWRSRPRLAALVAGIGAVAITWMVSRQVGIPLAIEYRQVTSPSAVAVGWALFTNPLLSLTLTSFAYALSLIRRRDVLRTNITAAGREDEPPSATTVPTRG